MTEQPNGTTIWVDPETKDELQRLAESNGRSLVGQLRWMLKIALYELQHEEGDPSVKETIQH